jgi:3-oxoacyl-[acyl-carrier protein] reductase
MDIRLDGKHALVCGGSRGIGRAIAEVLAEAGASVTLFARDQAALDEVRDGLATDGDQSHGAAVVDLSDGDNLDAALSRVLADRGAVDILVNNSGGPAAGPAHAADASAFEAAFRQHLLANHHLVQATLPGMRERGGGRIINIISTSVYEPIPGLGVSNTIRGAVASWAKTLSKELGPDGITVNNVLPGFTDTDRLKSLFEGKAAKTGTTFEAIRDAALASVPLGRFADPRETAMTVCFLASDAGGYISGVSLAVDGGRLSSI